MIRSFRNLIERQIQKARLEGKLEHLEGEGKPLPARPEEVLVDKADAVGFRIMAQAGVVPEEIGIKKQIIEQQKVLSGLTDPNARKAAMEVLAKLETRYGIAVEARKKFLKS